MKNIKTFIIQTLAILFCYLLLYLFAYMVSDVSFIIIASFMVGAIYGMILYAYKTYEE